MANNNYGENINIKEENTFNEFKSFKAENYFVKENSNFFSDFVVKEISDNINNNPEKQNAKESTANTIKKINKLTKVTQNISTTVASHASVVVTTAIAVVSASVVGIIPTIDFAPDVKVVAESVKNIPLINKIVVNGQIANIDLNYRYFALVDQLVGEEFLETDKECDLTIDETGNFTFSTDAFYGVTTYQYDIFYKKIEVDDNLLLYSSSSIDFTLSQDYSATYDKIKPNESQFTFNDDGTINVHIETNFESEYEHIYQYGLNIIDKEGIVHAQYIGNDKSIDLTLDSYVEQIFYEYIDIGEFNDTLHEYNRYLIDTSSIIKLPTLNLSESFDFIDDKFAISYQLDSIYDYTSLSLDLTLSNDKKTINKHIDNLSEKSFIVLDEFDGEIGNLTITGELNIQDTMIDNYPHKIKIQKHDYVMNYYFNVTKVQVDAYEYGIDCMPITLDFDYILPSTYKMRIKDSDGKTDETIEICSHFYLPSSISYADGGKVDISILDANDNIFDEISYDILSFDAANSQYQYQPSMLKPNPSESLVTYNDDGTFNLYRNLNFNTDSPTAYYDAFIFEESRVDDVTGEITYVNSRHNLSNSSYSIIEDIEEGNYIFYYYNVLKLDEIHYYIKRETPSGGINVSKSSINVIGTYDSNTNQTTIRLYVSGGSIKNECLVNGVSYEFDYESLEPQLIVDGNVINEIITIYVSSYHNNYDIIKEVIPLKGNEYKAYNLTINE